jgi:transposase
MGPGGLPTACAARRASPGRGPETVVCHAAAAFLRRVHPVTAVEAERKNLALELVADIRRLDRAAAAVKARAKVAVAASGTHVTDIYGVGPIVAALLIGHAGDITRFPTAGHFASYNGTAPIEASSGPKVRHRLNPRGNRQLNHALHMIAISQSIHATPGRDYYQRKLNEGNSVKEGRRALKRRISDAVCKQLRDDHRA